MAYKKLIKVRNVCQLLDKSKYPATHTIVGVTVTNNGDGSITANGNCTNVLNIELSGINKLTIKAKHKYLILDSSGSTSRAQYSTWVRDRRGGIFVDSVSSPIGGISYNDNECTVYLRFNKGVSVSNIVFKPQLFDLTEMYGAGHEPTTVEQFRKDFPHEMYDYSPHCWLPSYKHVFVAGDEKCLTSHQINLMCNTKNLFNPLGREDAKPIGNWPITKYDVGNVIYRGFSYSGYYQSDESYKCDVEVSGTSITVVQKIANYGIGYIVKCNPNTVYTLSFETNFITCASIFLDSEGNKLGGGFYKTFTTPNNAYYLLVSLSSQTAGTYFVNNLQIEEGNTATEYVPYGHL